MVMRWLLVLFLFILATPAFSSSCSSYDAAVANASAWQSACSFGAGSSCSTAPSATWVSGDSLMGNIIDTVTPASGSAYSAGYQQWICPASFTPPASSSSDAAGAACKAQDPAFFADTSPAAAVCSGGCGFAQKASDPAMTYTQTGSGAAVMATKMYPTGATCDASGSITNGSDSSVPTTPSNYPAAADPSPKVCGAGSCFDPKTGKAYYTTADGVQHEVDTGSNGGSGGCASSGGTTVCAGDPAPTPSKSAVANPEKQITASDTYATTSTDSSGNKASSQTTVNVYNDAGSTSSSGATSSDASSSNSGSTSNPSSASSSGKGDSGSVSGGGDCATPPICSGDAVQCAVVSQTWNTRCQVASLNSALDASKLTGDSAAGSAQAVAVTTQELAGDADSTGLDDSGWGFANKCPLQPVTFTMQGQTITFDDTKLCTFLGWVSALVLIGAYIVAARIIME